MKIGTNVIGNYSPYNNINKTTSTAIAKKNFSVNKAQQTNGADTTSNVDVISNKEKQFFASLYPEQKADIIDYHFYQNSGKMGGVSIGSLFDRRG